MSRIRQWFYDGVPRGTGKSVTVGAGETDPAKWEIRTVAFFGDASVAALAGLAPDATIPAPVLSGTFDLALDTTGLGSGQLTVSKLSTVYWALYPGDTLPADPQQAGAQIATGPGALARGFFVLPGRGITTVDLALPPGLNVTNGTFYAVARDERQTPYSNWSNVLKDTAVSVQTDAVAEPGSWSITVGVNSAEIVLFPEPSGTWVVQTSAASATIADWPGRT